MTDPVVAFVPLVTVRGGEQEGRKVTHDELIALLGDRRRSGVKWYVEYGVDARVKLEALYAEPDDGVQRTLSSVTQTQLQQGLDQYRAFLKEHGDDGCLIVAFAEAVEP